MHIVDTTVLVVYLLGITAIGILSGRLIKSSADYFMPRRFGKGMMIMHAFGTGTASDQAVSVAAATMRQGISGIWYQWLWLFTTPFYWLIAPIMRRFRATTTADVFTLRYDRGVAWLFALVGMASLAVKIGVMLKGAGALVDAGTGGLLNAELAIAAITVLFVTYGMAGGLGAAIVTDMIQGVMTLVFSFMLLPFVLGAVGGLDGVRASIGEAGLAGQMLSLVAPGKVGFFFIVMMSIQVLVGIVALPSAMGNSAAGKTELEGRVGYTLGTFIKRICTVAWCLTAIAAVAWYLNRGIALDSVNPDNVYGDVARAFLPEVLPGLLGLFLASLLAAVMSSCDSFMIAASGLFTENIYRQWRPDRSRGHYLWVGRLTGLVIVAGGLVFAFWVSDVIRGVEIWFKINPMMGIPFWLGLLWRRTTVAGAWASTLGGFGTWWLTTRGFFVEWAAGLPGAEALRFVWVEGGRSAIYEPWQILAYMVVATGAGIVVSLLTTPVPRGAPEAVLRPHPHADRPRRGDRDTLHPAFGCPAGGAAHAPDGGRARDPRPLPDLGARVRRGVGGRRSDDRGLRPADGGSMREVVASLLIAGAAAAPLPSFAEDAIVTVQALSGRVRIEIDGRLFTEYRHDLDVQPVLYPVIGPHGVPMTRSWPIEDGSPDEERDHVHHRSLWMTHGDINGVDFWRSLDPQPRVLHDELLRAEVRDGRGVVSARNRWVDPEGRVHCTDVRTITVGAAGPDRIVDYEVVLHASEGPFRFGANEEGMMAIRTHPALRLEGRVARGQALNSEGIRGRDVWGQRAKWVDYWAPIDGNVVGVAIFDHPENPRHPTWWHARHYGLITANPSGGHDATGTTPAIEVEAGGRLQFRYRFLFHAGDADQADIARRYEEYAASR